jgi:tripartite-type tricarboxylate transporter receptor subunit TctC
MPITRRALAVSSAERIPQLPEVPPLGDTITGFDVVFWQGLFAPAGTPAPILTRLGEALRVATEDAAPRARLSEQGAVITTGDAASLSALLAAETASWGRLIREQNIRAE